jgi:dUTP pyrophosphatase
MKLKVRIHPDCPNKDPITSPAKPGDVGMDLKCWIDTSKEYVRIPPHQMMNIRTGVFIELPPKYWAEVKPRSSTFAKRQLFVMGGIIDTAYRGELSVFVWNPSSEVHTVHNGDRLAQLIIMKKNMLQIQMVKTLTKTHRNSSGFGSTGH